MRKLLAIILCLTMVFTLIACSSASTDVSPSPIASASPGAPTSAVAASSPSTDNQVYTLNYASTDPTGSPRNVQIEEVLKQKLFDESNGRLVLQIYPSSTLAAGNEMLDALTTGTADMGSFLTPMFQGQFPYSDLYSTPGLSFGTIPETDAVLREFSTTYPDKLFSSDIKLCVRWSIGTMAVISVKPVMSYGDLKGLTLRSASSAMPFFTALGAACVTMNASDVYQGLKMGTINATVTGYSGMKSNKLAEVANYAIPMPVQNGEQAICMSTKVYNTLPQDLQAVIDNVFAEMENVITSFTTSDEAAAIANAKELNPKFTINSFSDADLDQLAQAGAVLMETKAADLDAKGFDGAGALAWLREHAK